MSEVTGRMGYFGLRLYINGALHVYIAKDTFRGVYSWVEHDEKFAIEVASAGNSLVLEYDKRDTWLKVLKCLEELLP